MINLQNITLQRGLRVLLKDVNLNLYARQKVGIIGANGCGKSSLFALLKKELTPETGLISVPNHITIAHVAQETSAETCSALDYVLSGDTELCAIEKKLEQAIADNAGTLIAELHQRLSVIDGYTARARAAQLLHGLGFAIHSETRPVSEFSGGWRMRLNLARALMCRSDLLLLDEPTNHLDLDAVVWLEEWLRHYPGTLLLISHDRDFLDNVVDHIAHIEQQQIKFYTGNYTSFEQQRAAQLALQQATYIKQQKQRAHIQSYIDRFRYKASKARQAQSRLKALARMETLSAAHVDSPFYFTFREPEKNPNPLLHLEKVDLGYSDKTILQNINLVIEPGLRLGLLGPNGAGKSTFIKLLAGILKPLQGKYEANPALRVGYFAQHQLEQLHLNESPLQHLQRLDNTTSEQQLRNYLGSFNFHGDMALSAIDHFSGGEKARLALALIIWQRPNLLLLDEPTNHLDLDMRQALILALQGFQGAMVIVSHDRYLLRTTTDSLILVNSGKLENFVGDQDDYQRWLLEHKRNENKKSVTATNVDKSITASSTQLTKRSSAAKIKKLEQQLDTLHAAIKAVEEQLADPDIYQAANKLQLQAAVAKQAQLTQQLQETEQAWLIAQEGDN